MALFGLGAVTGAFLGGKLTDRIGYYPVQLITLLLGGGVKVVYGVGPNANISVDLFIHLLTEPGERSISVRLTQQPLLHTVKKIPVRVRMRCTGWLLILAGSVGSALGGVLAAKSYALLFWVDGATNILAALLLGLFVASVEAGKAGKRKKSVADPLHSLLPR